MKIRIDLSLCLIFLLAFFLLFILFAYREPGVTADSVLYLDLANNIARGVGTKSFFNTWEISVHHPPLYVGLLAFLKSIGFDLLFAVRLLNSFCYGLVVGFVYRILKFGGMRFEFLILFTLILSLSEIFLYPFFMLWTEPVFLVFVFATIFSFIKFIRGEQMFYFYVAILMSALAMLTRYAGFPLLLWGTFLVLFFCAKRSTFKRIILSFIYLLFSALPSFIWLLYTLSLIDKKRFQFSGLGELSFHLISFAHFRQLARTLLFLIFPDLILNQIKNSKELQLILLLIFCIFFAVVLSGAYIFFKRKNTEIVNFLRHEGMKTFKLEFALIGFFFLYMMFLFFSISFLDFNTPLDYRICVPGFVVLGLALFCFFFHLSKFSAKFFKLVLNITICIFVYVLLRAIFLFGNFIHNGFGYTSDGWKKSKIIEFIRKGEYEVYSNSFDGIYFTVGRVTKPIPSKVNRHTGREIDKFFVKFEELVRTLRKPEKDTLIVYFNRIPTFGIPLAEEFLEYVKADKIYKFEDGVILYYGKKSADWVD